MLFVLVSLRNLWGTGLLSKGPEPGFCPNSELVRSEIVSFYWAPFWVGPVPPGARQLDFSAHSAPLPLDLLKS